MTGLYPTGTTCSTIAGKTQTYGASYDSWGNMTTRTATGSGGTTATLSYDGQDHLVRWNDNNTTTNEEWYLYDASGQRVLRRSQTGTGNSGTKYTLTAFGLEDHIYNGAGTNLNNKYYYYLAGRLIGVNTGSTNFLLTDALGTVVSSISNTPSSASVQGNQLYGPYGFSLYSKGTMGTTRGYTGQYNDSLSQLDYYNARYYDPLVGVFLSADTVLGNLQGMDPYAYVGANPETFNDPTGHDADPTDPYLRFVAAWYGSLEGARLIVNSSGQEIPNAKVPPQSIPFNQWSKYYQTGYPGNAGKGGRPDIANLSRGFIWEVKTGGGTGSGMGSAWPSSYTIAKGVAQALWYAARANATQWKMKPNSGWGQWQVGTLQNDTALADELNSCPADTCIIGFASGLILAIQSPASGVLAYRVLRDTAQKNGSTMIQPLSPEEYMQYAGQLYDEMRLEAQMAARNMWYEDTSDPVPPNNPTDDWPQDEPATGNYQLVTAGAPTGGWSTGPGAGCSFTATTVVATLQGERAIGQLNVGNEILAYNPLTHRMEAEPILHVWIRKDHDLIDLVIMPVLQPPMRNSQKLAEELIHTTSEHPFLTQEEGFVAAGRLQVGMHVLRADGTFGVVIKVSAISGSSLMYNLEIAQDHTFTVGNDQWIVHNTCE